MNKDRNYFSKFLFLVSIFIFAYVAYRSEIIWEGSNHENYKKYYLFSGFLILISILSFFLNQKIKFYFITFFFSFLVVLYLSEIYLTFSDHFIKKYKDYKKLTGNEFDKRSKFEVYNDEIKKSNNDVSLTIFPSYYVNTQSKLVPVSGISNSKTIYCNENGYYSIYESDRYGFNNPDTEWDRDEIDYILIGDSYVQGACVDRPNDIASQLRLVSNKPVLNLGYGANGPLVNLATLREYHNLNMKNVIWFFTEHNDLFDLERELKNKILQNYLNDEYYVQELRDKQEIIDKLGKNVLENEINNQQEFGRSEMSSLQKFFKFIKFSELRLFYKNIIKIKKNDILTDEVKTKLDLKKILSLAKNFSEKNNSKFYVVYLPSFYHLNDNYDLKNYYYLKKILISLDIPLIDIYSKIFKAENDLTYFFPFAENGHYTPEGYKKVANTIFEFLEKK